MFKISEIKPLVEQLKKFNLIPSGSYARQERVINDLDFITTKPLKSIVERIARKYPIKVIKLGKEYGQIMLKNIPIDIWRSDKDKLLFMKFSRHASQQFNIRARRLAKLKGYRLNDFGLYRNSMRVPIRNERELFRKIGMTYRGIAERI